MRSTWHRGVLLVLIGLSVQHLVSGSPVADDLSVAAATQHYSQHGGDGLNHDNDVGYLKKSDEKGGDGYEHFESFHNKDGDAYGYEKHEAFGGKGGKGGGKGGQKSGDYAVEEATDDEGHNDGAASSGTSEYGPDKHKSYSYSYNSDDDNNGDDDDEGAAGAYGQESDTGDDEDDDEDDGNSHSSYADDSGSDNDDGDEEDSAFSPSQYRSAKQSVDEDADDDESGEASAESGESDDDGGTTQSTSYSYNSEDDDDEDDEDEGSSKAHLKGNDDQREEDESAEDDDDDEGDDEEDDEAEKSPKSAPKPPPVAAVHTSVVHSHPPPVLKSPLLYTTYHNTVHPPLPAHQQAHQLPPRPVHNYQQHPAAAPVHHHQPQPQLQHYAQSPAAHGHDLGGGHAGSLRVNDYESHVVHTLPATNKHSEQLQQYPASTGPLVPRQGHHDDGDEHARPAKSAPYRKPAKKPVLKKRTEQEQHKSKKSGGAGRKPAATGADGADYSYGQQFLYASEADADATY